MTRFWKALQVVVFAGFLAAPAMLPLLGVPAGRLAVENRPLAPLPAVSTALDDPTGFGRALAAHVRDAAPFRDLLIRTNSRLRLALFGESPVPGVLVGRDGWLYYSQESALDDYLRTIPLSEEHLATMIRVQAERRDWLAARGMTYLVVFAPNKAGVYPETLPEGIRPLGAVSRLDQLLPRLRAAGIAVLDLRRPLAEAKAIRRAYQKTDTHWNGFGALWGASAVIEAVRQEWPGVPALDPGDYTVEEKDRPGGDLAEMLLLPDIWREPDIAARKRSPALARPAPDGPYPDPADHPDRARTAMETDRPGWPRAVFFHDSFARAMIPYLAERFSRSVFLWSHAFSPDVVEAERPDVVVLEVVERYVFALTLENPRRVAAEAGRGTTGVAVRNAGAGGVEGQPRP